MSSVNVVIQHQDRLRRKAVSILLPRPRTPGVERSRWLTVALLLGFLMLIVGLATRPAQSKGAAVPGSQVASAPEAAPPQLAESDKTISQPSFTTGQKVTYTITLRNSGSTSAVVSVRDTLPEQLSFVQNSATGGGSYDAATRSLVWNDVAVAAGATVPLSFEATASERVAVPMPITNIARISADGISFVRGVTALLTPEQASPQPSPFPSTPPSPQPSPFPSTPPMPGPKLGGFKTASQFMLAPGEQLTYTIRLFNSGNVEAVATVTDPIPAELSYVTGSVSDGGTYNATTKTITWNNITVPPGGERALSFDAKLTGNVAVPRVVINRATITSNNRSFERHVPVSLIPEQRPGDVQPPVVQSLTIGTQDVLNNPAVKVHIAATDNVGLRSMYLREWRLATTPFPHWQTVRSSGWVPFKTEVDWTLGDQDGTHFIGVWVADTASNVSRLDRRALDFASLVRPGKTVAEGEHVPYLVYYNAGVTVNATLTSRAGNADLFVWYPGSFGAPDKSSLTTGADSVSFTTPRAGLYVFVAVGKTAATYDLSITPGGGPRFVEPTVNGTATDEGLAAATEDTASSAVTESPLARSGTDPLYAADDPSGPFMVFLPMTDN